MAWNYRVVEYTDGSGFGLHEVYYDKDGTPTRMTKRPCGFFSEELHGLHESMILARGDAIRQSVVKETEIGKAPSR